MHVIMWLLPLLTDNNSGIKRGSCVLKGVCRGLMRRKWWSTNYSKIWLSHICQLRREKETAKTVQNNQKRLAGVRKSEIHIHRYWTCMASKSLHFQFELLLLSDVNGLVDEAKVIMTRRGKRKLDNYGLPTILQFLPVYVNCMYSLYLDFFLRRPVKSCHIAFI